MNRILFFIISLITIQDAFALEISGSSTNIGIGTTSANIGIGSYTSNVNLKIVSKMHVTGAADSTWPGWYDNLYKERYYGFTNYVASEPVPSVFENEIVTTKGIIVDHNGGTAGRWGVHVFDGFGAEYGKRVSILSGYNTDEGALYYFERKGQHYGKMRIGADLTGKGMTVTDTAVNFEGTDFTNSGFLNNPNATAVGIGTFITQANLHVKGSAYFDTTFGNVGIGSLRPGQILDIAGTARMLGLNIGIGTTSTSRVCINSSNLMVQCNP